MKTLNVEQIFIKIFIIIFSFVLLIKVYINNIVGNNYFSLLIYVISIFMLLVLLFKKNVFINKQQGLYIILCIFMLLPSFFNNAYLNDGVGVISYIYYIVTIIMAIVIVLTKLKTKNIDTFFKILLIFALITSLVTWLSFFIPSFFLENIVTLLPLKAQKEVTHMFLRNNAYAGLTDHYSRNAFYVILGIISCIYFSKSVKKIPKKNLFCIIFFIATLFLIGKRGHLIFLIASFIITYFVYYKVNIKTIFKFCIIFIIFIFLVILGYFYIPGIDNVVNRFSNTGVSNDISTGRFDLYKKAINMYKNNDFYPIGWGQFSKSTNYNFAAVHNDYLQIFIETGFIGFILIIGSNFLILIKIVKKCKDYKNSFMFIILLYNIFFMMYSLTGLPHFDIEVYMFYYFINSVFFNHNFILNMKEGKEK